jgi:redox-sensitive bicupin YhaK (pirin superfamily)
MEDFMTKSRKIEKVVAGQPTSDGAGVKLTRALTHHYQARLDPFLMLDYFHSDNPNDYLAGFPDHPHRGFETVTYMLEGKMRHRDSAGHEGLLESGGVQWMTTGRGLIHSELPEQENGLMSGFQLWLNLPASEKMKLPKYRDFKANEIPEVKLAGGGKVKVIAGKFGETAGAVQQPFTDPLYLDIHLSANEKIDVALLAGHHAFLFVYEGEISDEANTSVKRSYMGILEQNDSAEGITLQSKTGGKFILIAGKPLKEPIVQYGPFVMNTEAEIKQAFVDYQNGVFEKTTRDAVNLAQQE